MAIHPDLEVCCSSVNAPDCLARHSRSRCWVLFKAVSVAMV